MKKFFSLFAAVLFAGSMMAAETVVYTLTPASGSNNSYAGNCDITIEGVTWNLTGNSTMQPWRIGGKSLTAVDRALYSKTAIEDNITKIEIEHGAASSITVNSLTVIVASDANFADVISTLEPTFTAKAIATVERPDGADWSNAYYKFVYNVTVSGSSNKFLEFKNAKFYAEEGEAPAVEKPTIAGDAKFLTEVEVSISAEDGASIYYTVDGTEPTAASTPYAAPFTLTESATVKAIAKVGDNVSAVASKAFVKIPVVTCAEANALAKDAEACLNEVTVVYVNGANIYVKDESGSTLVYAFNFGLVAGDVVSGIIGVASPYNGLPELKPSVTLADLTVNHGEAPAPEVFAAAPVAADVNKYIIMKGVEVATGEFTTASATNLNLTIGEETVVLRNAFKLAASFDATKKYDVVGAVAIYNSNVQVYFINATESTATAIDNTAVDAKAVKIVRDGQILIVKGNKTFNLQGQIVR